MDPFVSKEWTAPATTNNDTGWDHRPNPKPSTPRRRRHDQPRKGASSLTEMAARVAAVNIHKFNPSYLNDLAPKALQAVLKQLTKHPESMSLSAWKTAWKIIQDLKDPNAPMTLSLQRFHQHFEAPTADLPVYLKPLQSGSFAFISHLKIAGSCLITSTELILLPGLVKNLGVLEIIEPTDLSLPFPRPSDRMIKAWTLQSDPFPMLKVLRIHTKCTLTEKCLEYVTKLRALAMFEAIGAIADWRNAYDLAQDHGWIACHWRDASRCRVSRGQAYSREGASITMHMSWSGLAKRIGTKSRVTHVDAGVQGYETYTQLEQPVLTALQGGFALDDTHMPSMPFVSLTLGRNRQTIGAAASAPPAMDTFYFWRYWEHGNPGVPEGARFSPAQNATRMPVPTGTTNTAEKRTEPSIGSLILRPRKRTRVDSIGEALSMLQGN
ncbi:hypothetical protein VM1G_07975 [Cytospora mali]|uniref:Uncharacterized protein n=1 Tax=Cytospora mali TaxID=578113 RepID=A0A194W8J5_CYTMA|nr:hypothetical protein VM1G_07975 [Valsa mali]